MNTITITGRLTDDISPESYETGEKVTTVARFTVAVDRGPREGTDFVPVTAFNGLAATCADQIGRGHLVGVVGRLNQAKWTTDEGENRSRLEVIASQVDFLARPAS